MTNEILIVYQAPWNWDFLWNRSQPLAKELSRHATVIYVDAAPPSRRNAVDAFVSRIKYVRRYAKYFNGNERKLSAHCKKINDALYRVTWASRGRDPGYSAVMDRPPESYRRLSAFVKQLARLHREVWLLSSRPSASSLFDLHPWDRVIADIEDPWLELSWGRSLDKLEINRLFHLSDVILANGPFLAREWSDLFNVRIRSLPNGIDEQFVKKLVDSRPRPAWLVVPEGSISAVYTGNINDRIDLQWLWDVVGSCPRIEFFLVGPDNLPSVSRPDWQRVCGQPNVHHIDRLPHDQMPAVLSHSDVLLLPYVQNGATTMFPAKLYEYMAAGRPVVSTVDYAKAGVSWPLFRHAPDARAMISALESVLFGEWSVCESDRRISREIALANTWESRVVDFFQIVHNAPRKRPALRLS